MSEQIAVRIPSELVADLDRAVAEGRFASRAAALREGLEQLLGEERERAIEDAYRRGYGETPQEEWTGEMGRDAMAAFVAAEESGREPL
jgi:Arc/MetJ-type ribon-helix-helix transcriptional regulator